MSPPKSLPAPLAVSPLVSDWIRFGEQHDVEVFTGRVELGQGNLTALLQMAADELCLAAGAITITPADTKRTPNEGFTAGSMSVSQGGLALRYAVSAARVLILREAARRINVGAGELTVLDGAIQLKDKATGQDIRDIGPDVDLNFLVADYADPLPRVERINAGTSLPRIDLGDRVLGSPFVHDLRPEGLLHGRMVRPPAVTAKLKEIDLEALRARPGVLQVVRDGSFLGLVADTSWNAIRAADWARQAAQWTIPEGPKSPYADIIKNASGPVETVFECKDETQADTREFQQTVTRPFLTHASIGPAAAMAVWNGDKLDVQSHSQGVFQLRGAMATVLGMRQEQISIAHMPGAGCYGHNGADDAALDAALLARAVPGQPVLVVWSRADEFRSAPLGPAMATTANASIGKDGRISSIEVIANSVPHANRPGSHGAPNLLAGTELDKPFPFPVSKDLDPARGGGADRNSVPYYDVPSIRASKRLVHDLPYRTSSLRALGATVNVTAIEALMDRIATKTGQDPVALRLAHLEDPRARAVIDAVMQDATALQKETEGCGWGLAFARYKNTSAYAAIFARVEVDAEVRVTHIVAAIDAGEVINPDGVVNQTEGGITQAISWALKEEILFDGAAVATETWSDYPILKFNEVPDIAVRLIERPDDPPLGCAEAVQGPTVAAVCSAIYKAIGVQVTDMPFTRDKIVTALM